MRVEGGRGNVLSNNVRRVHIEDAYVLCCTEHFAPELLGDTFGRFCVEISSSIEFFEHITRELAKVTTVLEGTIARISYRSNTFVDAEPGDVPLGFLKARDRYADQREVRMLWRVDQATPLGVIEVNVSEAFQHCRRVA